MLKEPSLYSNNLPAALYSVAGCREIDRLTIEQHGVAGYELMCRAGLASWQLVQARYPHVKSLLLVCGAGNNAGDGYVVARLALENGYAATALALMPPESLQGDAARAWQDFVALPEASVQRWSGELPVAACQADLVVDAIFGTGLSRDISGDAADAIAAINASDIPALALDVPSGLDADRGQAMGCAVQADATITFIGNKLGLHTAAAPRYCGELFFAGLNVPQAALNAVQPIAKAIQQADIDTALPARDADSHKGSHGHVLIIGGDRGMGGAVRLAVEAALRAGAGKVSVATRAEHVAPILVASPESMPFVVDEPCDLDAVLQQATVIAIGCGLGLDDWGRQLRDKVKAWDGPLVVDADALTLLAEQPENRSQWLLTPHPGEAARLLNCNTASVQQNRRQAAEQLQQRYGGAVVLKGNGSLVATDDELSLCGWGNAGMAVGGSGDVLTGIAAAMLAQGLDSATAAKIATAVHAQAGDAVAERQGQRGMLPRDVIEFLPFVVNPCRK